MATAVRIRGPFLGPSGYDNHVRQFSRELVKRGVAVQLENLDQRSRILELGFDRIDLRNPDVVAVRPRQTPPLSSPPAAGA